MYDMFEILDTMKPNFQWSQHRYHGAGSRSSSSSPNPATDAAAAETCLSSEPDEVKLSKSFLKVTKEKKKIKP